MSDLESWLLFAGVAVVYALVVWVRIEYKRYERSERSKPEE